MNRIFDLESSLPILGKIRINKKDNMNIEYDI